MYKVLKKENNFNLKFVLVLQVLDREYFKEIKNFVKDNFKNSEKIFLKNLENIYLKKL